MCSRSTWARARSRPRSSPAAGRSPRRRCARSTTRRLEGGGVEQDPHEWWTAVLAASREALEHAALPAERVIAVKCATQWAVTVPVDRDGEALERRHLVDGHARRRRTCAGSRADRSSVAGYDVRKLRRWLRLTGGAPVLSGVDGLGHVLHLKHDRPEVYAAAHKLLEPADYLNLRLTGRFAASFGTIFPYWLTDNRDPRRIDYDPGLLRIAGLRPGQAPGPRSGGRRRSEHVLPAVAEQLGLAPGTPVMAGACDLQAAARRRRRHRRRPGLLLCGHDVVALLPRAEQADGPAPHARHDAGRAARPLRRRRRAGHGGPLPGVPQGQHPLSRRRRGAARRLRRARAPRRQAWPPAATA